MTLTEVIENHDAVSEVDVREIWSAALNAAAEECDYAAKDIVNSSDERGIAAELRDGILALKKGQR